MQKKKQHSVPRDFGLVKIKYGTLVPKIILSMYFLLSLLVPWFSFNNSGCITTFLFHRSRRYANAIICRI